MKTYRWLVPILLVVAGGCTKQEVEHEDTEAAAMQLFEKGRGLRLPDEMLRTLGVETVEAAEKTFQQRIEASARVYQSGQAAAPARASAVIQSNQAARLKTGQPVSLRLSAMDSIAVNGRLVHLDSQTTALGQVEALIEFPDSDGRHAAGTSLAAVLVTEESRSAHAVPVAAVQQGPEGAFVYTVNGAHFVRTPVKVGAAGEGWVEIADGIYAGDVVVAKGGDALWMIELCALKGGTPCCPVGRKSRRSDD